MEPCYRVATDRWKTADDHWVTFSTLLEGQPAPEDVIISSVVPSVEREIVQMCERWMDLPATVVDPVEMEIMPLDVDFPREVGADRVVNCYGAVRLFGAPAVVVDFGTATTFDVISEDGTYRGGMILPGPGIAAEALFEKTALLPKVDFRRPTGLIGKNTVGSIRSGLYYGLLAQVEGIIERIREEVDSEIRVIATGGVSRVLARECAVVDAFEPLLTLKGLAFIYRDYVQAEE
jgi:type III pantothenate kinase